MHTVFGYFNEQTLGMYPQILLKLVLAVLLSGLLGLERERKGRAAGLRTHILVCLGATLLMITADIAASELSEGKSISFDVGRVMSGIVTGIGFLGAGTIIRQGSVLKGLTTAATIWFAAALGVAIGSELYLLAVTAAMAAFIVVAGLSRVEHFLPSHEDFLLTVSSGGGVNRVAELEEVLKKSRHVRNFHRISLDNEGEATSATIRIQMKVPPRLEDLTEEIQKRFPDVKRVSFEQ
jgi:putative Mg2+ transporter-C (MgtC) family protein